MPIERVALVAAVAMFGAAATLAHPGHKDAMENAKVLDMHTPKEQVEALMSHFNASLGVECSHCHVGEGNDLSTYDFASDAKPAKEQTRMMMRLTHMINESENLPGEPFASHTEMDRNRVNCMTCHQGNLRPQKAIAQAAD